MITLQITPEQLEFMQVFLQNSKIYGAFNHSEAENELINGWLTVLESTLPAQ